MKDRVNMLHLRKTFQCDQCDQALTKKNCLRPHIQFVHENFSLSATNAPSMGTLMDIYTIIFFEYLKARGHNVNVVMTYPLGKQPWQSTLKFDIAWKKSHLAVCVSSVESLMPPKVVVDKHIIFHTMEEEKNKKQFSCGKCGKALTPNFFWHHKRTFTG